MKTNFFDDIWLFGSYARGDENPTSDLDVLVISDKSLEEIYLKELLSQLNINGPLSISHYSRDGISSLISQGSLFAWHLKLESMQILSSSGWLAEKLNFITPYKTYYEDMLVLQVMVDEARQSLESDSNTLNMEASVLSVALRNAAMMTTFITNQPDFSSMAIFKLSNHEVAGAIFKQLKETTILDLIGARLVSERGFNQKYQWNQYELIKIANEVSIWLKQLYKMDLNMEGYHAAPVFA